MSIFFYGSMYENDSDWDWKDPNPERDPWDEALDEIERRKEEDSYEEDEFEEER